MKRCTKCVMTETWSGITFDQKGVCNICRKEEERERVDWNARQKILEQILKEYKEYAKKTHNKYDCVVGYSGGKDSAYILWATVKEYGMKPLVVTFDHGFLLSKKAEYNLMEIPKKLDCDHLRFTLGKGLRNALCRQGSKVNGDFCWHCHNGVGMLPARISKQWNIPLQIWGDTSGTFKTFEEYKYDNSKDQNKKNFHKLFQLGITPEIIKPENYEIADSLPMQWPKGKFPLTVVYLGDFEPWDQRKHVEIITKELEWEHSKVEGTYVDWDKVDCPYEPVRDWQKFTKRGFGRTTFQASKDIRDGLISRDEALELVEKYDGKRPKALDRFLEETEITEEEFMKLTKKHLKRK